MKNKKQIAATFFFILVIAAPAIMYFMKYYTDTHIYCSASYSAKKLDSVFIAKNTIILNGKSGTIMMDGKITDSHTPPIFFKLRNNFNFEKIKFAYHIHSKEVSISSNNTSFLEKLNNFLPDVIIKENYDSFFYIYPNGNDRIIYSGNIPILYCAKKANSNYL